jgi:hypothetical protein
MRRLLPGNFDACCCFCYYHRCWPFFFLPLITAQCCPCRFPLALHRHPCCCCKSTPPPRCLLPSVAVTFSKSNTPLQHQATPLDLLPLVAVRTARQGKNPAAARRCCVASPPSSSWPPPVVTPRACASQRPS